MPYHIEPPVSIHWSYYKYRADAIVTSEMRTRTAVVRPRSVSLADRRIMPAISSGVGGRP